MDGRAEDGEKDGHEAGHDHTHADAAGEPPVLRVEPDATAAGEDDMVPVVRVDVAAAETVEAETPVIRAEPHAAVAADDLDLPPPVQREAPERGSRAAAGNDDEGKRRGMFGLTPGRAAAGLTAAAAAAYAVYLLGATRGRRRPVTELPNALGMRLDYVPWGDVHYAFYAREGHGGRPLVLLHSINAVASAHEMRPLARAFLRDRERPVYALEWLGFGHSDRPEIEYTPGVLEDQLEHWLERVIRPAGGADVVGFSLGASYAAEVARRRPDLIRSLVALEPAGLGDEPAEIGRGWSRLLFTLPGVQRAFYDRLTTPEALTRFARQNLFTPEFGVPDEYVNFAVETARVEGAANPLDDFLGGRMAPDEALETYRRLRQPLLVIHGTVENRRMESYTRLPELDDRPNVTVVSLPTGAMPHWERAREVVQRIRDFYDAIDR
ncbi:MAG TPA: alpha/beta fold hydrolase [Longimicrobium sp.]|jgi:pimeloyl-ACP methyl ester carboxylesterase